MVPRERKRPDVARRAHDPLTVGVRGHGHGGERERQVAPATLTMTIGRRNDVVVMMERRNGYYSVCAPLSARRPTF